MPLVDTVKRTYVEYTGFYKIVKQVKGNILTIQLIARIGSTSNTKDIVSVRYHSSLFNLFNLSQI